MTRGDFKLVTHPEHQPAVDFITRSGEGPFIDTGVVVHVRNQPGQPLITERVYLSTATIAQLATMIGLEGLAEATVLHEQKLIAQGKVEAMKEGLGDRLLALAADLRAVAGAADLGSDSVVRD